MSDVSIDQPAGLDEFLDFCNNTMPARIAGLVEQVGVAGDPSRLLLHLTGLLDREPSAEQWDAAHRIARRFGMHPGQTRWEPTSTDARGRHSGTLIFERWHVRSN